MSLFIKKFKDVEINNDVNVALKQGDHILVKNSTKNVIFGNIGILATIGATVYVGTKVVKKIMKNH